MGLQYACIFPYPQEMAFISFKRLKNALSDRYADVYRSVEFAD